MTASVASRNGAAQMSVRSPDHTSPFEYSLTRFRAIRRPAPAQNTPPTSQLLWASNPRNLSQTLPPHTGALPSSKSARCPSPSTAATLAHTSTLSTRAAALADSFRTAPLALSSQAPHGDVPGCNDPTSGYFAPAAHAESSPLGPRLQPCK